jgi:hypothetical protein
MPGGFNHLNIADGYERAYDMLMKWKWIQPLRFLDSITRWMWVLTTNFPMSILHSLDMSVVLIVVKELLMWSASFVVSNPIRRIRRLVWGECFDTTYVGLLMGWVSYQRGWVYWTFRRYDWWGSMYVIREALEVVHNSGSHHVDEIITCKRLCLWTTLSLLRPRQVNIRQYTIYWNSL